MAGRILIVDDVATNRIVLKVKLTEARYEVLVAEDAATGLQLARSRLPDLVLLDGCLSGQGGVAALRQLREDPATARIPVIIMLGDGDPDLRLAALQAGADDVMTKPMDEPRMLARLRALLRSCGMTEEMRVRDAALGPIGMTEAPGSFARPGLVALVADKPGPAMHMRSALALHMTDSLVIRSRDTALGVPDDPAMPCPDVYVIEADLSGKGDGLRLMSDLRSRSATRHSAVCVHLRAPSHSDAAMAFDLGADDVIDAGLEPREVAARLVRLLDRKRRDDQLRATLSDGLRLAVIDPLTGLFNRRYALAQLGRIAERAQRGDSGFAVLAIDLDRFKAVNDSLGHMAGDKLLAQVSARLKSLMGENQLCGRFGGDEFAIVLRDLHRADDVAKVARQVIEHLSEPYQVDQQTLYVGASVGSAMGPRDGRTVEELMRNADLALYRAKDAGGGEHCKFEPVLHASAEERRQLEMALREALGND
jgi:two-component system cell cycle response regulator